MLPIFRALPQGEPAAALVQLLAEAPGENALESFVPRGVTVTSEAEDPSEETILVGLSDAFWGLPEGERYAAAAQVVHTLATLEEGKRVLLLDGTVPGALSDGNGDTLELPLTRASFAELEPWVTVVQPVAGSAVGRSFPIELIVRDGLPATAVIEIDGQMIPVELSDGEGRVRLPKGSAGDALLRIEIRGGAQPHLVEVPLTVAG